MAVEQKAGADAITGEGVELKRVLGPWQLIAVGIGAIIGAGIFVITGTAAAQYAGPAIVISFVIAGVGCVFAGLCYAELAAMIPFSGSAYTYAYAAFGRFAAWIIGWDLVLEYGMAAASVSVGWSGYFSAFMTSIGLPLPAALSSAPITIKEGLFVTTGAIINLPAVAIIGFLTALLIVGIRTSATVNGLMVLLKVGIVVLVILFGLPLIQMANLVPFIPENTGTVGEYGWSGVLRAAGVIFFAYIGFDAVSVAAQEAKNPQRDMPIGILGSLAICTVLYILMSLTMVGLTPYSTLNVANPVSVAVGATGDQLAWLLPLVNLGAIAGLSTVILISLYGQSRIFYSMSRDGLLPWFDKVSPTFGTPVRGTLIIGAFSALFGGLFPLDILGELVSIGTLLAFILVCIGVVVLRYTKPNVHRPFKTPFSPIVPILGVIVCGLMMALLPADTWIRLGVWFILGLVIYALYGVRHARKPTWMIGDALPPAK
ncbi:MAG: amino acid permease [Alphaproteobacteria bacterium]|nr:amino acid permease [Alphaproteobacteria bacterium]